MSMPKITVLKVDDWQAVYADNRLMQQGHSIQWEWVLEELGVEIESMWVEKWFGDWNDHFPTRLDECEGLYADE